jgi:hypothetical protein
VSDVDIDGVEGATIETVRWMTDEEVAAEGWQRPGDAGPVALELSNRAGHLPGRRRRERRWALSGTQTAMARWSPYTLSRTANAASDGPRQQIRGGAPASRSEGLRGVERAKRVGQQLLSMSSVECESSSH